MYFVHFLLSQNYCDAVADQGFPVAGGMDPLGRCGHLMQALFAENVCENERIGSRRGRAPGTPLDPPM